MHPESRGGLSHLCIVTQGFLGSLITDLHSDLKNSKWWIQYGGQVTLMNFYKPRPRHIGSAILNFLNLNDIVSTAPRLVS